MSDTLENQTSLFGISTVAGRYVIGRVPMRPGINLYACRLRSISITRFGVVAPVIPVVGETVTARLGPFGTLSGTVHQQTEDGFVVAIAAGLARQHALAVRIGDFRSRIWSGNHDRRSDHRFMPGEPRSVIARPDGWAQPCLIVDFSSSGAAISAAYQPEVGEVVTIGQITGRVVRVFDVGFAVRFFEPQKQEDIETLLEAPEDWRRTTRLAATRPFGQIEPELIGTDG